MPVTTVTTVDARPPNSLLLITDPRNGVVPAAMADGLVAATGSCVVIGTLSEVDGSTRVELMDAFDVMRRREQLWVTWEGELSTTSGHLAVMDVHGRILASHDVGDTAFVRLVVNDLVEPDHICVVVAAGAVS